LPATHDVLLFVAKDQGLFPAELDIELISYKNSGDILRDLAADRIDLGIPGVAAPVNFIAGGHKFTIVGGAAAQSAAVVVLDTDAKRFLGKSLKEKLEAFRGLRVGTVRQSTGDALFRKAVYDARLSQSIDIREYSDPNALLSELKSQFINAAVLWSPHMSRAEAGDPKMKIVMWLSEVLPNHVCCRQVVQDSFLQARRQSVVLYLVGVLRAARFYRDAKNRPVVLDIAGKWIKGTPRDILERELFIADADHKGATRTTLSADLNQDGIRDYVNAMRDTFGFDQQKVQSNLAKVDSTVLTEAYQYLGMAPNEAQICVKKGMNQCSFGKAK
jgi:ABC-type nitrate/sulfonate/bicarbonate transport system substrate-binding protein